MSNRDINDLHPDLQPLCREFLAQARQRGIDAFVTYTYRSDEEQAELYAQGRTKPGPIVTRAKPGQSAHNFTIAGKPASKAFDIAIRDDNGPLIWDTGHEYWLECGEIGLSIGLDWGGSWKKFKDFPHFQLMGA